MTFAPAEHNTDGCRYSQEQFQTGMDYLRSLWWLPPWTALSPGLAPTLKTDQPPPSAIPHPSAINPSKHPLLTYLTLPTPTSTTTSDPYVHASPQMHTARFYSKPPIQCHNLQRTEAGNLIRRRRRKRRKRRKRRTKRRKKKAIT